MASAQDIYKLILDADGSKAVANIRKTADQVNKDLSKAGETASSGFNAKIGAGFDKLTAKSPQLGKVFDTLGVSASNAGSLVSTALVGGVAVAGAAIGKFALDGVSKFENLALSVGKFSEATGLSTQDASKFTEVANDLGIGADKFQNAFVKMEKQLQTNRSAFKQFIATSKDGSVDLVGTFENVTAHLQGISDPIQRASESAKFFGKGFADVAEAISLNADDLKKRLDGVDASKVITPKEVQQARDYRDALDKFHDSIEAIQISIGQKLIPTLTSWVNAISTVTTALSTLEQKAGVFGKLGGDFVQFMSPVTLAPKVINMASDAFDRFFGGAKKLETIDPFKGLGDEAPKVGAALNEISVSANAAEAGLTTMAGIDPFKDFAKKASDYAAQIGQVSEGSTIAAAEGAKLNDVMQTNERRFSDAADAVNTYVDAIHQNNSDLYSFLKAQDDANQSILEAAKAHGKNALANAKEAVDVDSAVDAARKHAAAQYESAKAAHGAEAGIQAERAALVDYANKASGPVKAAILGIIAGLDNVSKQRPKPTVDINDKATPAVDGVKRRLLGIDGFGAAVYVNANDNASQTLINIKQKLLDVSTKVWTANLLVNIRQQGKLPGNQVLFGAEGFHNFPGGLAVVGEKGPELVRLPKGADVIPHNASKAMVNTPRLFGAGNDGAAVYNITINGAIDPVSTAKQIKKILTAGSVSGIR